MFGGYGVDSNGDAGTLNDLWRLSLDDRFEASPDCIAENVLRRTRRKCRRDLPMKTAASGPYCDVRVYLQKQPLLYAVCLGMDRVLATSIALVFVLTVLRTAPALSQDSVNGANPSDKAARVIGALRIASGCSAWERLAAVEIDGIHTGDGLDGTFEESLDTQNGRSVTRWHSERLSSADGYDGVMPWSQDFSAGTLVMNAPSARATARSRAWMNARDWCSARAGTSYHDLGSMHPTADRALDVIAAVPAGGAMITLFISRASHLIDHTVMQLDENHEVVSYSDWRTVGDAVVPFELRIAYPEDQDSETRIIRTFRPRSRLSASAFAPTRTASNVTFPAKRDAVRVPYVLDGFKPIVNVKVNGKGPFPFVVDAGGHFILTAQTAEAVGLHGRGVVSSVNERNVDRVGFAEVGRLEIGQAVLRDQVAKIEPYGFTKLERGPRPPKAGWLGREFFERLQVTFNPTTRMMTLRALSKPRPVSGGSRLPLLFDADSPLTACHIDRKPGLCMLDTGNAGATIVADTWARRNSRTAKLQNGIDVGGERVSRATVAIGPFVRRSALVSYASSDMANAEPYTVEAAILSEELLDRFVLTFDYARRGVWLQPVGRYAPLRFNRSGVIAAKTPDGSFIVRRLIGNSPAVDADLRVGDRILSIDDVPASHFSGSDFSRANAAPRARIAYLILRGTARLRVSLALRDLLPNS